MPDRAIPPGSVRVRSLGSSIDPDVPVLDLARELIRRLESHGDAPIRGRDARFLGLLSALIGPMTLAVENRFSLQKCGEMLVRLRRHPEFSLDRLRGARCADLGCGSLNPLGNSLVLLAAGAGEAVALDAEPPRAHAATARTLYHCAVALMTAPELVAADLDRQQVIENLRGFDLAKLCQGDIDGSDASRLRFFEGYLEQAEFDAERFDVVSSNALLEHVLDPDSFIAEIARISAKGAIGCHLIDGSDHRRYVDAKMHPLEMLCEASDEPIVHLVNRVRPLQLPAIFEAHGFKVCRFVASHNVEIDDDLRSRLTEPFRSMSDEVLGCVAATIHVIRV